MVSAVVQQCQQFAEAVDLGEGREVDPVAGGEVGHRQRAFLEHDGVVAGAAVDGVVAAAAVQRVGAFEAADLVVLGRAEDHVAELAAIDVFDLEQMVDGAEAVACPAGLNRDIAGDEIAFGKVDDHAAARNVVLAREGPLSCVAEHLAVIVHRVDAAAALQRIVALVAAQRVAAEAAGQLVVPAAADKDHAQVVAEDRVVVGGAHHDLEAGQRIDVAPVVARRTAEHQIAANGVVVAGQIDDDTGAGDRVHRIGQRVLAATAGERVVAFAAHQHVVADAAEEPVVAALAIGERAGVAGP